MSNTLLERVQAPGDVKLLAESDLPALCEEIRQFLTDFFKWNGNAVAGYDEEEVNYYLWLSEEPERKKA